MTQIERKYSSSSKVRPNDRSSDAISPNFIYGCCGGCMSSYCYVGRYNADKVRIDLNTQRIFSQLNKWALTQPWPKKANQVDPEYYVIDIGCSTDVGLHWKHYDWHKVLTFFDLHPKLKSSFATKYPSMLKIGNIHRKEKHRVRISLMPQTYSTILEPHTDLIDARIDCMAKLSEQVEVHLNFSPIIYADNWLAEYEDLFKKVKSAGIPFKSECIFLTYSQVQANRNSTEVNALCYNEDLQETKTSEHGGENLRYKHQLKGRMIENFKDLYGKYFDLSTIRYIF